MKERPDQRRQQKQSNPQPLSQEHSRGRQALCLQDRRIDAELFLARGVAIRGDFFSDCFRARTIRAGKVVDRIGDPFPLTQGGYFAVGRDWRCAGIRSSRSSRNGSQAGSSKWTTTPFSRR